MNKKRLIPFFLFTLLFTNGCQKQDDVVKVIPEEIEDATITVLNVGKGDAIILQSKDQCVVIDTGYEATSDDLLSFLKANNITTIDYLIITHFDKDHVGGADNLMSSVSINHIVQPAYTTNTSKQYLQYVEALSAFDGEVITLTQTQQIQVGDMNLVLYPAQKSVYDEEDNDFSIATHVTHGVNTFFFAGDAEKDRIKELVRLNIDADILKVPHHGRIEDNSADLLTSVSPDYAIITCDSEEEADAEYISLLESMDIQYYFNCNGDITISSDGTNKPTISQ